MARLSRLVVPNQTHHVIQKGHDEQIIFKDAADYAIFLDWLKQAADQFNVAIHAFVLMPSHYHLLVTPEHEKSLSLMMQWLGRYYVPYFNKKYKRSGALWAGRFKAIVVEAADYLIQISLYIESNPVRMSLTSLPEDYLWSSYNHHIGCIQNPLITEHHIFWDLGNTPFAREAAYKLAYNQFSLISEENKIKALSLAIHKSWTLGSADFKESLERQMQRRVQPAKRGRPRI